jgi:hypothetical protein
MKTTKSEVIDMSATAIARRLEQVRALYKLMVSLRGIRMDGARSDPKRS